MNVFVRLKSRRLRSFAVDSSFDTELQVWRGFCNDADLARFLPMIGMDGQAIRKMTMKRKKLSLFEETKILMVMKICNISRSKAIEYIAAKMPDDGQKKRRRHLDGS